ncbi:hypothetical protein M0802_013784 [Mischocyttarus mexicanus]|nr:hypothetical protein M0802_013784 [Mischocyttarus mexicanus]
MRTRTKRTRENTNEQPDRLQLMVGMT